MCEYNNMMFCWSNEADIIPAWHSAQGEKRLPIYPTKNFSTKKVKTFLLNKKNNIMRKIYYCIGVDSIGQPIYVVHFV